MKPGTSAEGDGEDDAVGHAEHLPASPRRPALLPVFLRKSDATTRSPGQLTIYEHTNRPETNDRHRLHVYNALYHDHLLVLRDTGLIDYDLAADTVS